MVGLLTKRLILAPLTIRDADELFAVRGDPEAMAFWDWPSDASPQVTAAIVEQLLRDVASGGTCVWTVRLRSEGSFVGLCDLSEIQAHPSADIGFMLARRFWGLGLAQEVVAWVLEQARTLGLESVHARIHSGNNRSRRLLERTGFMEVGEIFSCQIRPGVYRDCRRFEIFLGRR
jgi:RimJ/RimL family protein N-acetyltransferase